MPGRAPPTQSLLGSSEDHRWIPPIGFSCDAWLHGRQVIETNLENIPSTDATAGALASVVWSRAPNVAEITAPLNFPIAVGLEHYGIPAVSLRCQIWVCRCKIRLAWDYPPA